MAELPIQCDNCHGTGMYEVRTLQGYMKVGCHKCNGEMVITENLLKRQAIGYEIRDLRRKFNITLRELSSKTLYAESFISYMEQGKAKLHEIQNFLILLKKITDELEIITEYVVTCAESSTNYYQVYKSESKLDAEKVLINKRQTDGILKVYDLVERQVVRKKGESK